MPALNFKSCFAPAVQAARKRCTIRRPRKVPIVAGDRLYLYTDQRSRHARKLAEAICTSVEPFCIWGTKIEMEPGRFKRLLHVRVGDKCLLRSELNILAKEDGFAGPWDMLRFFHHTYGIPFEGVLIRW